MSYRCVDWSKEKADERVSKGKNAIDPYINSFSKGCQGKYINDDDFNTDDKTPCVFRGLGKSPMIWDCIENNIRQQWKVEVPLNNFCLDEGKLIFYETEISRENTQPINLNLDKRIKEEYNFNNFIV